MNRNDKTLNKLAVHKETIRTLQSSELRYVPGGIIEQITAHGNSGCDTNRTIVPTSALADEQEA